MREAVLDLEGVGRVFPGEPEVQALHDVSLRIERGAYVAIMGPSGSGKSTLLHVLGLLDRPTSGRYLLEGIDTTRLNDWERAALRGRRIGFVFQSFYLLPHRDLVENVALAEMYCGAPRRGRDGRALAMLERLGLAERARFRPTQLSGGERQRVAMARALVTNPAVLLCDEPTGNLDSRNTEGILRLLDELHADGNTIVVITHDPVVGQRAEWLVRIEDGGLQPHLAAALS